MNDNLYKFYGRRKGRGYKLINQQIPFFLDYFLKGNQFKDYKSYCKNILEIGFGNAENLIKMSARYSNINFIGAEPYLNSCLKLSKVIAKNNIKNIKIWSDDIRKLIEFSSNNIFDLILILHPDPWPKKKHSKRRLIQQNFIDFLEKILKKNGQIIISTDVDIMKSWILEQFHIRKDFEWHIKNINICSKKPLCLVNSKYSKKAISMRNKNSWFIYRKL